MMRVISSTLLLLLLFFAFESEAQEKSNKLKQEQLKLEQKISATKSLLSATQKSTESTLQEIKLIDQNILFRERLLANIDQQIRVSELKIKEINTQIEALNTIIKNLKEQYKAMVLAAYKTRNKYNRMMFVFSSENFNQAFKRMKYLEKIKEVRMRQVLLIKQNQKLLAEKIGFLNQEKLKNQLLAKDKIAERIQLQSDKQSQQEIYQKYKVKEDELLVQLQADEQKRERIKLEIKKAIERELELARKKAEAERIARQKAAAEKTKVTGTPTVAEKPIESNTPNVNFGLTAEAKIIGADFLTNKGRLPWPVERGTITEPYGKNPHPTVANVFTNNYGIDISTPKGANVRSVYKGEVSSVLTIPGAGKVVIIKHGNFRTVYSNLKVVYVEKGAKVDTKQVIGALLTDGNISVSHFEIHEVTDTGVTRLNPSLWISN
jgi:septal ring factor EnvC (AmiA/AmiB activator)